MSTLIMSTKNDLKTLVLVITISDQTFNTFLMKKTNFDKIPNEVIKYLKYGTLPEPKPKALKPLEPAPKRQKRIDLNAFSNDLQRYENETEADFQGRILISTTMVRLTTEKIDQKQKFLKCLLDDFQINKCTEKSSTADKNSKLCDLLLNFEKFK